MLSLKGFAAFFYIGFVKLHIYDNDIVEYELK